MLKNIIIGILHFKISELHARGYGIYGKNPKPIVFGLLVTEEAARKSVYMWLVKQPVRMVCCAGYATNSYICSKLNQNAHITNIHSKLVRILDRN